EHGHRAERREVEQANVEIGPDEIRSEREYDERREHWAEHDRRSGEEERRVGQPRPDVLLPQQLERVGEGLEDAEWSGVIGADPVLHLRLNLAVEEHLGELAIEVEEYRERHGDEKPQN